MRWSAGRAQAFGILLFAVVEIFGSILRAFHAHTELSLLAALQELPWKNAEDRETILLLSAGRSGLVAVAPLALVTVVLGLYLVFAARRSMRMETSPPIKPFLVQIGLGIAQAGALWTDGFDPLVELVLGGFILLIPATVRLDERLRARKQRIGADERL